MAAVGRQLLLAGLGEEQLEQLRPEVPATLLEELRPLASLQLGRYRITAVHTDVTNSLGLVGPVGCSFKVGELLDIRESDGMLDMNIVSEDWLLSSFGMYYEGKLRQSDDMGGVSDPLHKVYFGPEEGWGSDSDHLVVLPRVPAGGGDGVQGGGEGLQVQGVKGDGFL